MSARCVAALALFSFIALIACPVHAATTDVRLADSPASRAQVVSDAAPVLEQPAPMTVAAGFTADQTLHATDADGDSIFFSKSFGPAYMTVTTTGSGGGAATGNVHLAPTLGDIGDATGSIVATDGILQDTRPLVIHVTGADRAPTLAQPSSMSARSGETVDQALLGTDPDQEPLTFLKVSGPGYLSVQTIDAGTGVAQGNARIAPGPFTSGSTTGTVAVSDGVLSDQKSFQIDVAANSEPYFSFLSSIFVRAGAMVDQPVYANDPDGDPLSFAKVSGPTFMTVSTDSPGSGFAIGNIHVAPPPPVSGTFFPEISVSDGAFTIQQSFVLQVLPPNRPPVFSPIADMTVTEGEIAEQTFRVSDADNDFIQFFVQSGPVYMSLRNFFSFPPGGTIRLAPTGGDVGTATATIVATDFTDAVTESFNITVASGGFPPPCSGSSFPTSTLTATFGSPDVATADFNGDQNADLVIAGSDLLKAAVFLGVGDGTFGSQTDYSVPGRPNSFVVGDFNSDATPDLVVSSVFPYMFSTFLGNGDGSLGPRIDLSVSVSAFEMVADDWDHDGKMDLGYLNALGNLSVRKGRGDGTFGVALDYSLDGMGIAIARGDLTGDGFSDLALCLSDSSLVRVYRNDGHGAFIQAQSFGVAYSPTDLALADLNGDGKLDLAVTGPVEVVSVRLGNGDGTFGSLRQFGTGQYCYRLTVADLNGDGKLDIATANFFTNSVSILLGNGLGAFSRSDVSVPASPFGIIAADIDSDLRQDLVCATNNTNALLLLFNRGCAPAQDRPPKPKAPAAVAATENVQVTVAVTASDADGDGIASLTADVSGLPVGNNSAFAVNPAHTAGTFTWTPTFGDARVLPYVVTFTAANALSGSATTRITVANVNRAPSASAGGPYTGFVNSPLAFDGGGSSDPDGDPLTYFWIFGDGMTGVGVNPSHTYHATGLYGVAVTVSDGSLTGIATSTATVVGVAQARAFIEGGSRSIRLTSGKPEWCAQVEPVGRAYANVAVDLGSLVMKSPGTGSVSQIPAISGKTAVGADRDGNGVEEIAACFGKTDLRLLFSDLHGTVPVTVTIEGTLITGGLFRASMDLLVTASGGGHTASLSPNPLNPEAVLTFVTKSPGPVQVRLFDMNGRLVRSLLDDPGAPAGYHDVRIDGRDASGARLASGLYFYRIDSKEGRTVGKVSVLK